MYVKSLSPDLQTNKQNRIVHFPHSFCLFFFAVTLFFFRLIWPVKYHGQNSYIFMFINRFFDGKKSYLALATKFSKSLNLL